MVELIPSLSSFTYKRHELMEGTEVLRLDFFEKAVEKLKEAGVKTAYRERIDEKRYIAEWCTNPPFEIIVKNYAVGSVTRNYPGLFEEGTPFVPPLVKFDFRKDPEDYPIPADYLRAYGCDPDAFRNIALTTNKVLCEWLAPNVLLDFCIIIGQNAAGEEVLISEMSPDCMRLRSPEGNALDKDLFRQGKEREEIIAVWSSLIAQL